MTDDELDARFRALPHRPPPAALVARTLAAVEAERRPRRWRWALLPAGLAAAWLLWPAPPPQADPAALVPRGVGEVVAPSLRVELAVRSATGDVSRATADRRYHPGEILLLRVSLPAPSLVTLTRGQEVLWSGPLPAGETPLPVGYTFEPGEASVPLVLAAGEDRWAAVFEVAP